MEGEGEGEEFMEWIFYKENQRVLCSRRGEASAWHTAKCQNAWSGPILSGQGLCLSAAKLPALPFSESGTVITHCLSVIHCLSLCSFAL